MNTVDKIINYFSPHSGLKRSMARLQEDAVRTFANSGYSESGASRTKKSMKGWTAKSKSPQEDIDKNLDTLRQRSRDLYMSAPLATSAIKTNRTNVVGSGLKLKARIDFEYLGITREQADKWEMNTEREFGLWAESVWCDTLRLNNFYELQQLALMSWLMNGDGFGLIKQDAPSNWMPYSLRIHLIESDRVCTPNAVYRAASFLPSRVNVLGVNTNNKNPIYNGVEVDKASGAVVAYWVCNQYPNSNFKGITKDWTRVEAFGEKTGNPNILHLMEQERCEQYRGVPYLAPVIECLKQITRYTEATLTAAVVQSFFTAFIKSEVPGGDGLFGSTVPREEQVEDDSDNEVSYELGAGTINVLRPGEDVEFGEPKQPTAQFDAFVSAMAKYTGAALEIPYELLIKSFMASYSASRAALLEAWKAFRMRRTWFANDFCQPVYELWLSEAVARGRINAPGFFNDPAKKKAWCKADWNGPSPGQIDPVKEVQAATLRVQEGYSTRERETIELTGGDWDKNIVQVARENELKQKAFPANNQMNKTNSEGADTNG
ncbi:phage portal protein [Ruminiclostridium josui]|uniref:phage portal protein n=1 Tax=Ruminiclostridium josui TaxID=1499 RepID=UPI000465FB50|nr:phage portal protein [Ruminiclostridium josui]